MTFNAYRNNLIKACIKGNRNAQKDLYDLFAPKMMVVALRYSKSTVEAQDVLQEGFLKVFQNIGTLSDANSLEGWIRKIIVNTSLNQNRSKIYMFPMKEVEESTSYSEEEANLSDLGFKDLLKLIQSLPDGCQVIFNMYAIEGYSHKEISESLMISIGTSKSQLARARELLKSKLEKRREVNYGTI